MTYRLRLDDAVVNDEVKEGVLLVAGRTELRLVHGSLDLAPAEGAVRSALLPPTLAAQAVLTLPPSLAPLRSAEREQ